MVTAGFSPCSSLSIILYDMLTANVGKAICRTRPLTLKNTKCYNMRSFIVRGISICWTYLSNILSTTVDSERLRPIALPLQYELLFTLATAISNAFLFFASPVTSILWNRYGKCSVIRRDTKYVHIMLPGNVWSKTHSDFWWNFNILEYKIQLFTWSNQRRWNRQPYCKSILEISNSKPINFLYK